MFNISSINKAIAGGITSLLVAEFSRYFFAPSNAQVSALGVIVTGIVGYVAGHVLVYLSPSNKGKTV